MNSPPHTRTSLARSLRTGPCARPGAGPLLENSAVSRSSERRGEDSGFCDVHLHPSRKTSRLSLGAQAGFLLHPADQPSCLISGIPSLLWVGQDLGSASTSRGPPRGGFPPPRLLPVDCGRACPAFWTRALTLCPGDACLLLQRAVSSCWLASVVRG